ncbi:hypothetical protein [Paenibacillus nasutitermitis]|uniref:hypothetical protein n=1 Tax=Paenibacillus nasutitermitis TaxID=1652958 RepID=UPI00166C892B|nr:hypothetical protein [Paenibacillus nasutitermitis]
MLPYHGGAVSQLPPPNGQRKSPANGSSITASRSAQIAANTANRAAHPAADGSSTIAVLLPTELQNWQLTVAVDKER